MMDGSDHRGTTVEVARNKELFTSVSLQVHANGSEDDSRQDDRVRYMEDDDDCMDVSVERERNSEFAGANSTLTNFPSPSTVFLPEAKVNLSPRIQRESLHDVVGAIVRDRSLDYNASAAIMSYDDSSVSEHAEYGGIEWSPPAREFFRVSNGPSIPSLLSPPQPQCNTNFSNSRSFTGVRLQRCFAWSQDSVEQQQEQRAKRRREHQPETLVSSWFPNLYSEQPLFGRQPQRMRKEDNHDGPTYVHWEEKISDSKEMVSNVLRRALDLANDKGNLSRPSEKDCEAIAVANC